MTTLVIDRGAYFPLTGSGNGPVVSGSGSDQLYVLAVGARVIAVDARTGKTRWTLPSGALARSGTTGQVDVIGGAADVTIVAAGGGHGTSVLLDAWTGRVVARAPVPAYGGLAWADDRHAVVVASDGLRGIDLRTGATTWRHEVRGLDSRYDTGYAHGNIVVAADARTEQGTQAREILLLDAVTGAERGALPMPHHDVANRVTTAGGTIYVESPRRTYAIDAVTGRARWAVGNWPTETVDTDPVDGTAYLWDGKTRRYRVVGPDGRATTIGETVQCDLRAGTSLSCNTQAVARQQIVGYAASDGSALWTSPVLPYFKAPYSLSQSPSMPPPSYAAGIVCGHVDTRGPDQVLCTQPYLLAVNR